MIVTCISAFAPFLPLYSFPNPGRGENPRQLRVQRRAAGVIEAVFEDLDLKHEVLREVEEQTGRYLGHRQV